MLQLTIDIHQVFRLDPASACLMGKNFVKHVPLPDDAINSGFSTGGSCEFSAIYTEQYGRLPAEPLLFMKGSGMRPQGLTDNMECLSLGNAWDARFLIFLSLDLHWGWYGIENYCLK